MMQAFTMIDLLYPRRCPVCQDLIPMPVSGRVEEFICPECRKALPYVTGPACMKCGKPVELEEQEYCSDCARIPKHYIRGFPLFLYMDPIKEGVTAMKYHNRREYAQFYTEELVQRYGDIWNRLELDAVIPIPVHSRKRRQRGYNQAELLARPIADWLDVPMIKNYLIRVVDTLPQKELNDAERINNLKRAFQIRENGVKLNKVLLVDDIYTSGATMEACTTVLLQAGVREVYYTSICIGRGMA